MCLASEERNVSGQCHYVRMGIIVTITKCFTVGDIVMICGSVSGVDLVTSSLSVTTWHFTLKVRSQGQSIPRIFTAHSVGD